MYAVIVSGQAVESARMISGRCELFLTGEISLFSEADAVSIANRARAVGHLRVTVVNHTGPVQLPGVTPLPWAM